MILTFLGGFLALSFSGSGLTAGASSHSHPKQQKPPNPCNPCAKKGQNPGAPKKAQNPRNPCAKKAQNPCNPCAKKPASSEVYVPAIAYNQWKKVNGKPFLSQAHGGMFVTTYANTTANAAIKSKAASFPVGSILVKESFADNQGKPGRKGTIFAMEKTDSGWLWVTTDATGHITGKGDSGQMQMCAQCHTAAKMDSAFLRAK